MPASLVVKKGSKILDRVAASIPVPVSVILSITCGPRLRSRVLRGVPLVEVDGGRLERDPAAVRHGVPGVDDEIDDHLLDLPAIDLDEAGSSAGLKTSSMLAPISRWRMAVISVTTVLRSSSVGRGPACG